MSRKGQNGPQPWNRNATAEYSIYNRGFLFGVLYWVEVNAGEIKEILHTTLKKIGNKLLGNVFLPLFLPFLLGRAELSSPCWAESAGGAQLLQLSPAPPLMCFY